MNWSNMWESVYSKETAVVTLYTGDTETVLSSVTSPKLLSVSVADHTSAVKLVLSNGRIISTCPYLIEIG